jgi:hypothetical protein
MEQVNIMKKRKLLVQTMIFPQTLERAHRIVRKELELLFKIGKERAKEELKNNGK